MTSRLNPYLSFSGNARAAMEFYTDVFGGELTVSTFGDYGQAETPIADQIMHAMLVTDAGYALMGADTPPGMTHTPGDTITLSLSGDDSELLHGYWDKLSAGGTVTTPLAIQMWGDEYGSCVDPYGVVWLVNISQQPG
ncbi:MAG TPA: VOC family protein [Candidatus Lustribacter sp.]|nr:VOC family protein [Candidatus Lustribacter sp.]